MTYDELMTCELVRFYYSINPENHIDRSFKEKAFEQFSRLIAKQIPANDLSSHGLDFAGEYDDMCVDGYSYGSEDSAPYYDGYSYLYGDFTLFFDDTLIDEEEREYTECEASPVGIFAHKKDFEVLGPGVIIGKPVDIDTVHEALDGAMNGRIGTVDLGCGCSVIDCAMKDFELILVLKNGILENAMMLAISMRS